MSGQIYYVRAQDGNRYGPADLDTLNSWAAEGRINAATMIEIEGSAAPGFPFASLPGAMAPGGAAPAPVEPEPAPMSQPADPYASAEEKPWSPEEPAPASPFSNPQPAPSYPAAEPASYSAAYDRASGSPSSGSNTVTISIILSVVGILCGLPTAPFGLWMGMKAKKEELPGAQAAVILGWIAVVLFILAILGFVGFFIFGAALSAAGG